MKKFFFFMAAAVMSLSLSAGSYGIMINGTDYHAGTQNPTPGDPSFQEFMVLGVSVSAGATLQLYDADNHAGWAVDLDPASVATITRDGDHYNCTADGCYDFYIKLKMNADQLYIGSCSGEQPGGGDQPGGGEQPGGNTGLEESGQYHDFSLIGSIGGDWNVQTQLAELTFDERGRWTGSLAPSPYNNAVYAAMMDEEGNQYKTKGWQGESATRVTLYWANGFEDSNVWQLPANQTLYMIMHSCTFKGSIDVELVDQATYEAYSIDWGSQEGIENTGVAEKAHKMIIDGQLRIVRGDKVFDATGRQL